jgi:ABC-type lipoprotein export system ATPase subunit/ABC-type uncharacterized transport system permease subunit
MESLLIGLKDGLVWFPFVLGIGFLYTYLKVIDVSVDGIGIICGVVSAIAWEYSHSYPISIICSMILGSVLSGMIALLIILFKIEPLMAGIIFSLAAHSISVLWVGESFTIQDTALLPGFTLIPLWLPILLLIVGFISQLFYTTRFGITVRRVADGVHINTVFNPLILQVAAYSLSGCLYGLSAALYVHKEGLARSGGGFEILVIALASFLSIDRLIDLFLWLAKRNLKREDLKISFARSWKESLKINLWQLPSVKAIIGACLFQVLVFLVILNAPNPIYWKILLSVILLFSLINYQDLLSIYSKRKISSQEEYDLEDRQDESQSLKVSNLSVVYEIGTERRTIFVDASAKFEKGINIIRGSNGTGKSTLLGIINGSVKPVSADINYGESINISKMQPHDRPVFLMHQSPFRTISPSLTVAENLLSNFRAGSFLQRLDSKKIVNYLHTIAESINLDLIEPIDSPFWVKPTGSLSGGQATCVSLYCWLVADSLILLADEPTTGLDELNFSRLAKFLRALSSKKIIIVTTHDERLLGMANAEYRIEDYQLVKVN